MMRTIAIYSIWSVLNVFNQPYQKEILKAVYEQILYSIFTMHEKGISKPLFEMKKNKDGPLKQESNRDN